MKQNGMEGVGDMQLQNQPERPEKLIPSEPRLRGIEKVLTLLGSEQLPDGEQINWKNLHERVKPYHSMLEFSDNVRAVVLEYLASKIPKFKEALSGLNEWSDQELLDALANNWFEVLEREETDEAEGASVEGTRRQVLLTVAAHVVKRIETLAERKLLSQASSEQLGELGLDAPIRDLLVELLEIGAKSDPLFVRFLAYSQLSGKPPEEATPTGMHMPKDSKMHTVAQLFPRETKVIARKLRGVIGKDAPWKQAPGAPEFEEYLESLCGYYECVDIAGASDLQNKALAAYARVLGTDFPILVTTATEGYYKEPYLDPELKISVATPEARREEGSFKHARDLMAENLGEIGAEEFADSVRSKDVRSSIVLGGYGVNLSFSAVAQETPVNLLFLNEQIRTYDSRFLRFTEDLVEIPTAFAALSIEEKKDRVGVMSRMTTMLHEFGHPVCPADSVGGKRLGASLTIIDEVKAETLWRPLIPRMIENGFDGTSAQWIAAMLTESLMLVKDQPEDDPYSLAGIYGLNGLFEQGIVKFENNKISVTDIDAYYATMKEMAVDVIALYEDESMTEREAAAWVKQKCTPGKEFADVISFLKTLSY